MLHRILLWVLPAFIGLMFLAYVGMWLVERDPKYFSGIWQLALLTGLVTFALHLCPRLMWKRSYRKDKGLQEELTMEITESGIRVTSQNFEGTVRWAGYVRFVESETTLLLYVSPNAFHIFPKRAFSSDQLELFLELIRGKLLPQP
ncbi:MAG TPA: YcxB family protein [Terriglobales bacterium]|jgi:hypothetical protein|nr:YcxB family protein [Terriglobales bacterium]